jgi:DNA-binding PadR family transcriptional regulator
VSTYLRRTPALLDVLECLVASDARIWGLQISSLTGRPTGTVYPLLERLETERFIASSWDDDEDRPGPRRRLYSLTDSGRAWANEQLKTKSAIGRRGMRGMRNDEG